MEPAITLTLEARKIAMTALTKELLELPPRLPADQGALPAWELGAPGAWPRRAHVDGTTGEASTQI